MLIRFQAGFGDVSICASLIEPRRAFAQGELGVADLAVLRLLRRLQRLRREVRDGVDRLRRWLREGTVLRQLFRYDEARLLMTSMQQAFVNLRTGRPGKLPPPVDDLEARLDPAPCRAVQRASRNATAPM